MSEKLQEWIEAVDRALVLCRDCRLDDTADLITELAAYLRDGGWLPIESAPKDGSRVWVKRVHNGEIVKQGWAVWGVNSADAPMRQWSPGGLDGPLPPQIEYADTPKWLTEDRLYVFPTPTHYLPLPAPPTALATSGGEE
jgi:hypothetical protein